ncbi:MAG: AMP-binding protein [Rhodobacteraceae bacterium]|jgi:acyl-coenzyme A synthetase/AMP-(fatty) acid ligase|nr:AMP-binding protein [Paracoccaceae bacterium]
MQPPPDTTPDAVAPPAIHDSGPAARVLGPCPGDFNAAAHVLALAARQPDKVALALLTLGGAERWSYGRLAVAVGGVAAGLAARGLVPGDRVLMRLGNSPAFPVLFLACLTAGLIPVPTSAQLTGPEVTRIAAMVGPRLVVAGRGIALPDGADWPVLDEDALAPWHHVAPLAPVTGSPDRPAYIVFTSGTSGTPRAVVHAHRAIWARGLMRDGWTGLGPADRLLHAGAFNWTYTLGVGLLDPWAAGATALIPAEGTPIDALPLLMRRHDATIFAAAPGVHRRMLRGTLPPLPRLRHGLSAGEKLADTTRAAWEQATGTPLFEAYGLSECSTFISGAAPRPAPPGTLGFPQPGRRVAVVDDAGAPVARGDAGMLAVDAGDPGLMLGYLDAPDATAARFRGGWFLTGDMARMAADGSLTFLGRGDDMMNAGGYRVAPAEVEAALTAHPEIAEAAAVEQRVRADASVIVAHYVAPRVIPEAELLAFLAPRLARYKQPRLFRRVEALPRGPNGKLDRRALRQVEIPDGDA